MQGFPDYTCSNRVAEWLSGRVLDLRCKGFQFGGHCVVSLSKTFYLLLTCRTGSTLSDKETSRRVWKIVDMEKNKLRCNGNCYNQNIVNK